MTLVEMVGRKGFIVTSELTPPKGTNTENALKIAKEMSPFVDAVNVTDGQSAVMRMGSLALCHLLVERGIEPVLQLTCRDRNRIALQSELLNSMALGIRNVLCLTGDHIALGDHPDAKQVFDLDSVSLLLSVKKLNEGADMRGNALEGSTDLCPGAVVNPNASPKEPQLLKMKRKIETGARFFQTQAVFETQYMAPFVKIARDVEVPILMGILVLRTHNSARYIKEHVPGIEIPDEIVAELAGSEDPERIGIALAARLIREAKEICDGVHIMNAADEGLVQKIVQEAGIRPSD